MTGPGARPGNDGPRTDGMAADDPATARHERAKTRTFVIVLAFGAILLAGGGTLAVSPTAWAIPGVVLILLGLGLLTSGTVGLVARRGARRMLGQHPWREIGVTVQSAPSRSGRGRVTAVPDGLGGVKLLVSNVGVPAADALRKRGRLWYAGDLRRPGMIFVRLPAGEEIFLGVISTTR